MKTYNIPLPISEADAADFIRACETDFRTHLDEAVTAVLADPLPSIIALSGPTCSGKTTTANRLIERISASGHRAVVLSVDDFFLDRNERNRVDLEAPDYDSAAALDLDYLAEFFTRLRAGKSVLVPKYDFVATSRVGYHEYIPDPLDIYVVEGIQAVYPEVTSLFGDSVCRSIFISVTDDVEINGVFFSRHDIRLLRRIVRDYWFRGATSEFSFHLWDGVRKNEETNIFPNAGSCDVYINSFLPYEFFTIRDDVLPLLEAVPKTSGYRPAAEELLGKLNRLTSSAFIDDRLIPQNSVIREFLPFHTKE